MKFGFIADHQQKWPVRTICEVLGVKPLGAGSLFILPQGDHHYVWTKGETVVQLHGTGPGGITYVNTVDDPRKR